MEASRKDEAMRLVKEMAQAGQELVAIWEHIESDLATIARIAKAKELGLGDSFMTDDERAAWASGWAGPDTEAHGYLEGTAAACHELEMVIQRNAWNLRVFAQQWEMADQRKRVDSILSVINGVGQ